LKFIAPASQEQEMEFDERLNWEQYNAIYVELAGVKAMLSRAREALEAPVLCGEGNELVRKTQDLVK
jgi:hypothetical protein